jgi:hypothetical protein
MPLGDGDLIDRDVSQVLEFGLGIAPRQVALLDVFDQVPAHVQKSTNVARLPMGKDRKRRSSWPREITWREPQAQQRKVSGSWSMVKITWPLWYSVREYL